MKCRRLILMMSVDNLYKFINNRLSLKRHFFVTNLSRWCSKIGNWLELILATDVFSRWASGEKKFRVYHHHLAQQSHCQPFWFSLSHGVLYEVLSPSYEWISLKRRTLEHKSSGFLSGEGENEEIWRYFLVYFLAEFSRDSSRWWILPPPFSLIVFVLKTFVVFFRFQFLRVYKSKRLIYSERMRKKIKWTYKIC